jgi:hypothetical protein
VACLCHLVSSIAKLATGIPEYDSYFKICVLHDYQKDTSAM